MDDSIFQSLVDNDEIHPELLSLIIDQDQELIRSFLSHLNVF